MASASLRRPLLTAARLALVAPAGMALPEVLRVLQQFPTIQAAVDAAVSGDTVLISKGAYAEAVVFEQRAGLKLIGKGKPRLVPVPAPEGDEPPPALTLSECTGIELRGLTIERAYDGTDIEISNSAAGCRRLVVHTQPERADSMAFYLRHGFTQVGRDDIDVHLGLDPESACHSELST